MQKQHSVSKIPIYEYCRTANYAIRSICENCRTENYTIRSTREYCRTANYAIRSTYKTTYNIEDQYKIYLYNILASKYFKSADSG